MIKFKRVQAGEYVSEDGRYKIEGEEIGYAYRDVATDPPRFEYWNVYDTVTEQYIPGDNSIGSFSTLKDAKYGAEVWAAN